MTRVEALTVVASVLVFSLGAWTLSAVHARLRASRPDLRLTAPVAAAVGVRLVGAGLLSAVAGLEAIRDPDDAFYLAEIRQLNGAWPWESRWLDALTPHVHVPFLSLQTLVTGPAADFPLRVTSVFVAALGIVLAATAVHDLAGSRGAAFTAWVLAIEPGSAFFSGLVTKESWMLLSIGLCLLGGARMWRQRDGRAAVMLLAGVGLAAAVRPYVGGMLLVAALLLSLHVACLKRGPGGRPAPRLAAVLALVVLVSGGIALGASGRVLAELQAHQTDPGNVGSNLALEPVDFSTIAGVADGLPRRTRDLLIRPYPWQAANRKQRAGSFPTYFAYLLMLAALALLVVKRRAAIRCAPPVLYLGAAVLLAFALSTNNAGTGFRYRTHVLLVTAVLLGILVDTYLPRATRGVSRARRRFERGRLRTAPKGTLPT